MTKERFAGLARGPINVKAVMKWKNTSGETVPAYGVVKLESYDTAGDFYNAVKPDGDGSLHFVNGPVPVSNNAYGSSHLWDHSRIGKTSSTTFGEVVGPVAGSWEMEESGTGFVVFSNPSSGIAALLNSGSGGSSINLIHGIVHACLGEGYYEVEISEWSGRTPDQESSGSGSCNVCSFVAPAGSSSGGCTEDPPLPDFADSDSEEDNVIKRQTTGTGVIVLAYDPGSIFIPLVVGSDCRMTNTGEENPTVGTEDDSQSSGNTEPVYQIVRGHQEHLKLYREVWDCCNGQDTLISRKAIIFPGVECPEEVCTVCE